MKMVFTVSLLLLSIFTNAQFGHVSLGALIPKKADAIFTASFSGGVRLGDYLHIGASFGYYKFKGADKAVIPVGIEFSAINQKTNKLSPYVIVGVYYPACNTETNTTGQGFIINIKTSGVYQLKAGAGIGFPIEGGKKIILSGGYTPAKFKYETKTTTYGAGQATRNTYTNSSSTAELYFVSIGFLF